MPVAIQVQRSPGCCTPYAQLVVASATNYDVVARETEAEGAMDYPGEKVAVHRLQESEGGGIMSAGSGCVAEGESEEPAYLTEVVVVKPPAYLTEVVVVKPPAYFTEVVVVKPSPRVKDVGLVVDHEEMNKQLNLFFKTHRPYWALRGEATFPVLAERKMHCEQAENTSALNTAEQMRTSSASAASTDRDEPSANDASRSTQV